MADNSRANLSVKVDVDVSEALTGLKAIQREAKKATQALAELESDRKRSKLSYIVVLVESPRDAKVINQSFPHDSELTDTKIQAFSVGQGMCGIRFRNTRPTVIIRAYGELTAEKDIEWERQCVLNTVTPDTILI